MEKLKDVINREFHEESNNAGGLQAGQSPAQAALREGVETAKRRKQLVQELLDLDVQERRIQEERTKKLEMLAALV